MEIKEKSKISIWKRFVLKITSIKTILTIWAAVMFTIIIIKNLTEFKDLGYGLLIIIGTFLGVNVLQKHIEK